MPVRTVRLLLAVLGLHVLDDTALQPQPGTSVADHLPGLLIPLAVLAALAWAYPRLRPGVRGAALLALAPLALVMGIEAFRALSDDGLAVSGDDFTGLAAAATAPALAAIGAAELWRSRRRDGHLARRVGRRALLGVTGLVLAFELV